MPYIRVLGEIKKTKINEEKISPHTSPPALPNLGLIGKTSLAHDAQHF